MRAPLIRTGETCVSGGMHGAIRPGLPGANALESVAPARYILHLFPPRAARPELRIDAMSQDTSTATAAAAEQRKPMRDRIYLVSHPKVVFLYPTFLASVGAGLWMLFTGNAESATSHVVSMVFLVIFAANLVVLSFEFPRTTSLTVFFFLVAVGVALWMLFRLNEDLLPRVTAVLAKLNPQANSTFYFVIAGVFAVIYVGVLISTRFDYWEVRPNELLHHHGFMSDLKRYSAPHLRIDKEINDIFEYVLLRSGRLILHPSQERRAIVLENVFFINHKEEELTRMLGALQVQVRAE